MVCLGDVILSRIIYFRLLLLLARLSVGLPDEEANKLEAALTPLVHNGQEQVDFDCDDDHHLEILYSIGIIVFGNPVSGNPVFGNPVFFMSVFYNPAFFMFVF